MFSPFQDFYHWRKAAKSFLRANDESFLLGLFQVTFRVRVDGLSSLLSIVVAALTQLHDGPRD